MTIEAGDFVSFYDYTRSIHQGLQPSAYLQVKFPVGMTTFVVMEPTRKFFNLA